MAKARRCRVFANGAFQEAIFHSLQRKITYGQDNEPREYTMALVELKSGKLVDIEPSKVTFLDPPEEDREPEPQRSETVSSRDLLLKVERLKHLLVSHATGKNQDQGEYAALRRELTAIPAIKDALPTYVSTCRTLDEFWQVIKQTEQYAPRREKLRVDFHPLLESLERDEAPATAGSVGSDRFSHQFPAGLPFGLKKPHLGLVPQGGTQVPRFEGTDEIGVLRSEIYPSLTFASLQSAVKGSPFARTPLDAKLRAIIQTTREASFFSQYEKTFGMFTAEVPALVPQAWIQWHSLNKPDLRAAGSSYADDLYRVDFVVFWKGRRFAILIDDISHYAVQGTGRWDASESQYSGRLKEDRKLRKEGWDVFRVSNWEIKNGGLPEILTDLREFLQF